MPFKENSSGFTINKTNLRRQEVIDMVNHSVYDTPQEYKANN